MRTNKLRHIVLSLLVGSIVAINAPVQAAERADVIITGGTVVTMDGAGGIIENGAVAIRRERIVGVGSAAEIARGYTAVRRINAAGRIVMPGLVNTHGHVPMVLFRGIADDLTLQDWLQKYIFPAEARNVDEEFVRWGTRLGCLEMIRGGTTTYVDMYYFEDAVAEETARAGMRAILGETVLDFPAPDNKTWDAAMSYTTRFIQKWKSHPLITPAIAPHAPYTVSTDHLKQTRSVSERNGVPLLIHISEDSAEIKTIREKYNATPVAYLDSIGFLSTHVIAAHMVWPTDEDIKILAKHSVGVGHCPQSNMKLAAGISPVAKMLQAGVAVGLGTDGAASNHDLSMWEEIDTASKLAKVSTKDPTTLKSKEVIEMATIGGAKAINLEKEIGSLEVGKRADLILIDLNSPHLSPMYNVYSQLVFAVKASDVESVMINGKFVMLRRRMLTINERAVLAKAKQYRDKIQASLKSGSN